MTDLPATELRELGTATLYEASGLDCDLPPRLRPAWPGAALCGPALPVRTAPGDNLPLHLVLDHARPGDVLVVDGRGEPCGYWGEVLTVAAQCRGVGGLVIDGGVRDTDRLAALGFAVFSSAVAVRRTAKADAGTVGAPIELGGRAVRRGDVVVADADGVLVLPREHLAATLDSARARQAKEAAFLDRIRSGARTVDLYGFTGKE